jgi:site-specific DNA recombinase
MLRFAPLIRVSTEKQATQGESLKTQKKQIISYVNSLNGTIPDICWQYSGQEHATPDQERTKLGKLLEDSSKGIFDAVIVVDASRWSRDNLKSKEGLNTLRANGIKFFIGTQEYNLFDPNHVFYLGMSTEINEMQASAQSLKSITNRIERAKRGIPTAGKLPYGRLFDDVHGWSIDIEKQKIIQRCAKRYLAGESLSDIAKSYQMNMPNLHKILTKRSGTQWECEFINKKLNVHETVKMIIPPLLDNETIKAIKERIRINTTYTRGNKKHEYLLTGFLFCSKCGFSMRSYTNHSGKQYYRHSKNHTNCLKNHNVPATELENSLLIKLVTTFGDPEKIEKALQRATPNLEKYTELTNEKEHLSKELKKLDSQKNNLVDSIAEGILSKTDAKDKLESIRTKMQLITIRIITIGHELTNIPSKEQIKNVSQWAGKIIGSVTRNSPEIIFKRSFEWKRKLIEKAFSGVDPSGKRLGVYVSYNRNHWEYEIRGLFENTVYSLPMSNEEIYGTFHLDAEFQDVPKEIEQIRNSMKSNLHGIYQS